MKSKESYALIISYLSSLNHIVILSHFYDDAVFGNFLIAFKVYDLDRSIVCDRGELGLCDDLIGGRNYRVIAHLIYEIGEDDLIAVLENLFRSELR
jgi:hypothetical protein